MCSSRSCRAPRSRCWRELENLEIDAGVTYLDNEPLGRVNAIPLYREHYRLLTSSDAPLGNRDSVTWAEVAQVPLCLLTPDMQNRRIIDELLRGVGATPQPTLESNSMIVLFAHVRTGRWASVMPAKLAETLGLTETIRAIPIVEPEAVHTIGLVVPAREPMTPLTGGAGGGSAAAGAAARRGGTDAAGGGQTAGVIGQCLAMACRVVLRVSRHFEKCDEPECGIQFRTFQVCPNDTGFRQWHPAR